ncbi:cytochrome c [Endozoicomonas sp. SM1973]|uniref:Cytochrome c n=2 Tax=Spartinivicinus marinus TaxID=2994442 RepID=A0A853I8H6_9GAMM|nr:cytochrome c [Spartinivicinus marinus]NYZ66384.1 cytochrome c [Spartinivicinus marinus]
MLLPGVSVAAGDPDKGKAKAGVCAACHGKNGVAMVPIYPNLAGQNQAYLESSLKAYRAKQRQGGQAVVMQAQAASLSDEDIANLSAYYSSLQ